MRRAYLESALRFVFGLIFSLLLLWAPVSRIGVDADKLFSCVAQAWTATGLTVLYALPMAVFMGIPAGLQPGSRVDRLLTGVTLVLAGFSAVAFMGLLSGMLADSVVSQWQEALSVLLAAPWLALATRDGLAMGAEGHLVRAILGRLLQEVGNLLVITLPLQGLAGVGGLPDWFLAMSVLALATHLAGDLLMVGISRQPRKVVSGWLLLGGLMALAFVAVSMASWGHVLQQSLSAGALPPGTPGHPLGTDQLGRDVAARLSSGIRLSLAVALGAVMTALGTGALAAWIGRRLDQAATIAPKMPVLLVVLWACLGSLLLTEQPNLLVAALLLGLASLPPAAHAIRRLMEKPGAEQRRAMTGTMMMLLAQSLVGAVLHSVIAGGNVSPAADIGSRFFVSHAGAPHQLIPGVVLAVGIGGLFLLGRAFLESAGD